MGSERKRVRESFNRKNEKEKWVGFRERERERERESAHRLLRKSLKN